MIGPFFLAPDALSSLRSSLSALGDTNALKATGPEKSYYDPERAYRVSGRTAHIEVKGLLSQDPMPLVMYFGGGNMTYDMIIELLNRAEGDPNIDLIEIDIDSPGGTVAGMFETMERIKSANKTVRVVGYNRVQSAAYALAAVADEFYLAGPAVSVGSLGVAADFFLRDDVVTVVSSNAEDKRPDVSTEEGRATIRAELDEYEALFISAVAEGREVSEAVVKQEFGRGRTFLSAEAIKRGMADGLLNEKRSAGGGDRGEISAMDLDKLKAEHPAVYQAAVKIGADAERERCSAHLTMAKASGGYDIAAEAIEAGTGCSDAVIAKHTALKLSANTAQARADDNAATEAARQAASGQQQAADTETDEPDAFGLAVAEAVRQSHGVKGE